MRTDYLEVKFGINEGEIVCEAGNKWEAKKGLSGVIIKATAKLACSRYF